MGASESRAGGGGGLARDAVGDALAAAYDGNFTVVQQAATASKKGFKLTDASGQTLLHLAAYGGQLDLIRHLLSKGADVNARVIDNPPASSEAIPGATPLHYAVLGGHDRVVQVLSQAGAEINACTSNHKATPLHFAAASYEPDVAKMLLGLGADPQLRDSKGQTPYEVAKSAKPMPYNNRSEKRTASIAKARRERVIIVLEEFQRQMA